MFTPNSVAQAPISSHANHSHQLLMGFPAAGEIFPKSRLILSPPKSFGDLLCSKKKGQNSYLSFSKVLCLPLFHSHPPLLFLSLPSRHFGLISQYLDYAIFLPVTGLSPHHSQCLERSPLLLSHCSAGPHWFGEDFPSLKCWVQFLCNRCS